MCKHRKPAPLLVMCLQSRTYTASGLTSPAATSCHTVCSHTCEQLQDFAPTPPWLAVVCVLACPALSGAPVALAHCAGQLQDNTTSTLHCCCHLKLCIHAQLLTMRHALGRTPLRSSMNTTDSTQQHTQNWDKSNSQQGTAVTAALHDLLSCACQGLGTLTALTSTCCPSMPPRYVITPC